MKVMIRKDSKGALSAYVPKKDLEEPIVAMALPGMADDTPLPITVEARRIAGVEE